MPTNVKDLGQTLSITAPTGGTTVGVPIVFGTGIVLPNNTVAAGELVSVETSGVLLYAKQAPLAIAAGAALYWDDTNKQFTTSASGNTLAGYAVNAAAEADTTVKLKFTD
ncbi:MAG: DUF2190 family protein [Planctomycetota bacterium]